MALQNVNLRVDQQLRNQDTVRNEANKDQVGSGQFAATSGVFKAKENVQNQDQGGAGGNGSGAPADNFVGELVLGGYNSELSSKNRPLSGGTFNTEGDLRRQTYEKLMGSNAALNPLKLDPNMDYAEPFERKAISHAVHMAFVNKPIDMNHETNALTRQVALNRGAIRV